MNGLEVFCEGYVIIIIYTLKDCFLCVCLNKKSREGLTFAAFLQMRETRFAYWKVFR